jgi:hypothetical protein
MTWALVSSINPSAMSSHSYARPYQLHLTVWSAFGVTCAISRIADLLAIVTLKRFGNG